MSFRLQPKATTGREAGLITLFGAPMALWLGIFFLVPMLLLVAMSFWSVKNFQLSPDFTLHNWAQFFEVPYYLAGYSRSLLYAAIAASAAVLLALPVAYTLAFKVGRGTLLVAAILLIAPFFSSYLVRIYAWRVTLSSNGILNTLLVAIGLPPIAILDTPIGSAIGFLTYSFPLVTIIILVGMLGINRSLIEAAHNLGSARLATVLHVLLPLCKLPIITGATFAFIMAFGDFIAPSMLGGGRPPTLSILVIDTVKSGSNWPGAAVIAVVMIATLLIVSVLGVWLSGQAKGKGDDTRT
jgi:ABC-type spermidine/putrescine transport system permease subunit I